MRTLNLNAVALWGTYFKVIMDPPRCGLNGRQCTPDMLPDKYGEKRMGGFGIILE